MFIKSRNIRQFVVTFVNIMHICVNLRIILSFFLLNLLRVEKSVGGNTDKWSWTKTKIVKKRWFEPKKKKTKKWWENIYMSTHQSHKRPWGNTKHTRTTKRPPAKSRIGGPNYWMDKKIICMCHARKEGGKHESPTPIHLRTSIEV